MIAPAVAFSSVWRSLQRRIRRRQFQRSPNGFTAFPASPGRVVLVQVGQADSADSHEVLCPSAPAHRAALSGAAGLRTIPLRLLGWFLAAPPEVFRQQMEPTSLPLRYFADSRSHRSSRDDQMRCSWPRVMHRAFHVIYRDVPLPARHQVSRLRRNASVSATLLGFGPFAVLFLQRRFRSVSARLSPHAVNELPPRLFFRGTGRLIPLTF